MPAANCGLKTRNLSMVQRTYVAYNAHILHYYYVLIVIASQTTRWWKSCRLCIKTDFSFCRQVCDVCTQRSNRALNVKNNAQPKFQIVRVVEQHSLEGAAR